jgi:hypothetical protein
LSGRAVSGVVHLRVAKLTGVYSLAAVYRLQRALGKIGTRSLTETQERNWNVELEGLNLLLRGVVERMSFTY